MGVKHFKVWTLTNTNLRAKIGVWGKNVKCNVLNCVTSNGDDYVCGANDGSL